MTVRQRSSGAWEVVIKHRALARPYTATVDTQEQGQRYKAHIRVLLDHGEVPPELIPYTQRSVMKARSASLIDVLVQYERSAPIATSDRPMVAWLRSTLHILVADITLHWADQWVRSMKRDEHLAPGSIRKRVESLARALDWWLRREDACGVESPMNPLRLLPRGYSTYTEHDGVAPRRDQKRDRRLHPGEFERIERAILGEKVPGRQRPLAMPERAAVLLFFRVIVNTGLRLREAYRLRWHDVKFDLHTIHVADSKTGRARDVPMTREVQGWLAFARQHLANARDLLVFPFWDADPSSLNRTTSRLSHMFRRLFDYSGCEGLTEHDLRHEATVRWMLMKDHKGHWLFRPEEVRRITGHESVQVFERYLSMRGSGLAERLQ